MLQYLPAAARAAESEMKEIAPNNPFAPSKERRFGWGKKSFSSRTESQRFGEKTVCFLFHSSSEDFSY